MNVLPIIYYLINLTSSKTSYPDCMEPHVHHNPGYPWFTHTSLLDQLEPGHIILAGVQTSLEIDKTIKVNQVDPIYESSN